MGRLALPPAFPPLELPAASDTLHARLCARRRVAGDRGGSDAGTAPVAALRHAIVPDHEAVARAVRCGADPLGARAAGPVEAVGNPRKVADSRRWIVARERRLRRALVPRLEAHEASRVGHMVAAE
eukprot:6417108-Prymnesium_polylepis.1